MSIVDLSSIRHQVELLRFARSKIAELKVVEQNAKDAIQSLMKPGTVGILDDQPVCNWSSYKTNRFDQSAFAEDHPDLLEQYRAMKEVQKFEVL